MTAQNPKSYNTPIRTLLDETDVSSVAQAVVALTRELWVLSDRVAIMEAALADKGIDIRELIESYQPGPELQAVLDKRGQAMVANVVAALGDLTAD